jgi:hypothetical protein
MFAGTEYGCTAHLGCESKNFSTREAFRKAVELEHEFMRLLPNDEVRKRLCRIKISKLKSIMLLLLLLASGFLLLTPELRPLAATVP